MLRRVLLALTLAVLVLLTGALVVGCTGSDDPATPTTTTDRTVRRVPLTTQEGFIPPDTGVPQPKVAKPTSATGSPSSR